MTNWLRWLAVLPVAILARLLIDFPLHLVLYVNLTSSGFITPYPEAPERLFSPFVGAIAFIWAGAKVAPIHSFRTAMMLFGLWLLSFIMVCAVVFSGTDIAGQQWCFRYNGLASVMGLVGAFVGLYMVRRESANRDTVPTEELNSGNVGVVS